MSISFQNHPLSLTTNVAKPSYTQSFALARVCDSRTLPLPNTLRTRLPAKATHPLVLLPLYAKRPSLCLSLFSLCLKEMRWISLAFIVRVR